MVGGVGHVLWMCSFLPMFGLLSPLSSLLTLHFHLHPLLLNISHPSIPHTQTPNLFGKSL